MNERHARAEDIGERETTDDENEKENLNSNKEGNEFADPERPWGDCVAVRVANEVPWIDLVSKFLRNGSFDINSFRFSKSP